MIKAFSGIPNENQCVGLWVQKHAPRDCRDEVILSLSWDNSEVQRHWPNVGACCSHQN